VTPKYRRILLKLSGETLGGLQGAGFDYEAIRQIAESVIAIHKQGVEIGVVVGGGNIFRGEILGGARWSRRRGSHGDAGDGDQQPLSSGDD
jgi:uridylate kinase